ncbi:MAG: mechanosensitive ion channel, partial [Myxococcales bacterium]|nr:mechanosensitive ion channel [Myxococcales bacterium]
ASSKVAAEKAAADKLAADRMASDASAEANRRDPVEGLIPKLPPVKGSYAFSWVLLGLLAAFVYGFGRRLRRGLVPGKLASRALRLVGWFSATVIVVAVIRVAPVFVPDAYVSWMLVAIAVAAGWSTRDVLTNAIAWVVLRFEARVRPGAWVTLDGVEGTVEQGTLRAVWIRDRRGRRVSVPNREFLAAPVATQGGAAPVHDVLVRLPEVAKAADARQALVDATLMSPWVRTPSEPVISREAADPSLWRVRVDLLDPRFAVEFESQLVERVEEILSFAAASDPDDAGDSK